MINCFIIDDEQHAINVLLRHIEKTPYLQLAGHCTNPLETLEMVAKGNIDLLFLDVQMDEIFGIDLLPSIYNSSHARVILTTAYSHYAFEGFEHQVLDFLLKPVSYSRFLQAIQKYKRYNEQTAPTLSSEEKKDNFLFVKSGKKGKQVKIVFDTIDYIQNKGNYALFYCGNEEILALLSMRDLMSILPSPLFYRIHNSFIINTDRIASVETHQVILHRNIELPIGVTFRSNFFTAIGVKI
jgi:DNA-binding LytR/AlgR family response regulator